MKPVSISTAKNRTKNKHIKKKNLVMVISCVAFGCTWKFEKEFYFTGEVKSIKKSEISTKKILIKEHTYLARLGAHLDRCDI